MKFNKIKIIIKTVEKLEKIVFKINLYLSLITHIFSQFLISNQYNNLLLFKVKIII